MDRCFGKGSEVLNGDHGSNGFNRLRMNCAWFSNELRVRKMGDDSRFTPALCFRWQRGPSWYAQRDGVDTMTESRWHEYSKPARWVRKARKPAELPPAPFYPETLIMKWWW